MFRSDLPAKTPMLQHVVVQITIFPTKRTPPVQMVQRKRTPLQVLVPSNSLKNVLRTYLREIRCSHLGRDECGRRNRQNRVVCDRCTREVFAPGLADRLVMRATPINQRPTAWATTTIRSAVKRREPIREIIARPPPVNGLPSGTKNT